MNDHNTSPAKDTDTPFTPTVDQSGNPVEVVRKDIEHQDAKTEGVDKIITPTSIKEKEQDAETLNDKNREVERKLADND